MSSPQQIKATQTLAVCVITRHFLNRKSESRSELMTRYRCHVHNSANGCCKLIDGWIDLSLDILLTKANTLDVYSESVRYINNVRWITSINIMLTLIPFPRMIGWYVPDASHFNIIRHRAVGLMNSTFNRVAVLISIQNWLSETPEQSKNAATPSYMSVFMSRKL